MTTNVQIIMQAVDNASKTIGGVGKALEDIEKKGKKSGAGASVSLEQIAVVAGATAGAVFAVGAAMTAAFEVGKQGAAINQTEESFNRLLDTVGANKDLLNELRQASRNTVDDMTLMGATATLLAGTSDELGKALADASPEILELAKAANKLNPSLGDTAFLYQSLMTGIKRGSPMLIDNTGITLKLGEANEKMAASLGKSVEQLTSEEQKLAILNATLEAGGNMLRQVGGNVDSKTDAFARLDTATKNLADALKSKLAPGLTSAADAIYILITASDQINAAYEKQVESIDNTTTSYKDYFEQSLLVGIAADKVHSNTWKEIEAYNGNAEALGYVTEKLGILTETEWTQARQAEYTAAYLGSLDRAYEGVAVSAEKTIEPLSEVESILRAEAGKAAAQSMRDLVKAFDDVKGATENLQEAQANYREGVGSDFVRLLEDAKLEGGDYEKALGAIDEVQGTTFLSTEKMNQEMAKLVDQYKKDKDVDAFRESVDKLSDKFEPLNERVKAARDRVKELEDVLDRLDNRTVDVFIAIHQGGSVPSGTGFQTWGENATNLGGEGGGGNAGGNNEMQAAGGPVRGGYVINESAHTRPEMMVLGDRSGYTLTKQQAQEAIGGGGGVNIYGQITVVSDDPAAFVRQLQELGKQTRLSKAGGSQYQGVM